jgi:glutamate:GABA antiporter
MNDEATFAETPPLGSLSTAAVGRTTPPRVMGFADLLMFYVVTGISLRWIATAASAGPSSIAVWIFAWIFFYVPLALSVIELSSRYPKQGGMYIWSKQAFGDFSGYMTGWTYWTSNVSYYPSIFYFTASNALFVFGPRATYFSNSKPFFILSSLVLLAFITILNVAGLNRGKWLHNIASVGMWMPVLILGVMGVYVWRHFGSATSFVPASLMPQTQLKNMLIWATITFALCGCETGSMMGEEIKDPRRNLPRALLLAGLIVTICYIGGTIAILMALPSSEVSDLQGIMQAVSKTAARLGWFNLIPFTAALIAIGNVGAASGFLAASGRIPFAAGIDRYLPDAFGRLHPRWGTPHVSIVVQTAVGAVMIFLGQAGTSVQGAYDVLVSISIIGVFIPYLYVFASMFKIQDVPAPAGSFRVPGGPAVARIVASVGFVTTLVTIFFSAIPSSDDPNKLLAVVKIVGLTALLLVCGGLLFYLGNRRRSASAARA